ncbi:MAG: hypothetical protein HKN58_06620 [Xanthomonadales bacterium]|nr:hypothetical protein [Xanthomonadales bacterium]
MNEPNRGDKGLPSHTEVSAQSAPSSRLDRQKVTLIILLLAALGTVFLLPRFVTEPWLGGDTAGNPLPAPTATDVSPSTAAEKTAYRQESQTVLAQIIAVRDRLRERNVDQWATPEFNQALDRVQQGDAQYSYGEYGASLEHYRSALEQLNALETTAQERLAQALADGESAVESLNVNVANSARDMAVMLAPERAEVQALAARVETLPELAGLMEQGDTARAQRRLAEARDAYRQAVALDGQHQGAAEALRAVGSEVTDSTFRQHMSRGYAALDAGDFTAARAAFDEAETVRPGDPAIAQARAQVANRDAQVTVSTQLQRAATLEAQEQWAQAMAIYEDVLEEDPTLAQARARLVPVQVRAALDARLEALTEDPLKLAGETAHRNAQQLLADARGISPAGPRLQSQIGELDRMLELAVSPVNVTFRSDNQTHVTLFRVKDLGTFDETTLTLKPGRYTVAGRRQGYRDVQVQFTVTGEPLDGPIVVACEEPI